MTFQNMCSIFQCTHEESLALWDYLMFLRVKSMLRQPPLPAITEKEMEFEKSREASPLPTQRWASDIFGVPVELTNTIEQDKPKVHVGTQQWFDDMEAIRQGKKAPGDTAPPLSALADGVREDLKKEKAAALAFQLTSEPPKTKVEHLEKERSRVEDQQKVDWSNSFVGLPEVQALYSIRSVDRQMILCSNCHEKLWFGRVKEGTDIVCHQCGTMTKFQYEEPEVPAVDKVVGISAKAARKLHEGIAKWVVCQHCKSVLHFRSPSTRVDVTCYNCSSIVQYIDVVGEEDK